MGIASRPGSPGADQLVGVRSRNRCSPRATAAQAARQARRAASCSGQARRRSTTGHGIGPTSSRSCSIRSSRRCNRPGSRRRYARSSTPTATSRRSLVGQDLCKENRRTLTIGDPTVALSIRRGHGEGSSGANAGSLRMAIRSRPPLPRFLDRVAHALASSGTGRQGLPRRLDRDGRRGVGLGADAAATAA